jgi:hypothetical protein
MPYSLVNDEETRHEFCDLWPKGIMYICIESGLPDRFICADFISFSLVCGKPVIDTAKQVSRIENFSSSFLKGKVVPLGKADWILEKMIKIGEFISLERQGWITLRHLFIFLSQHGRIKQPWGVKVVRWLSRRLSNSGS